MSERILVFIPMYNCERQIGRVLGQFDPAVQRLFDEIIVIDNRSTDGSRSAAAAAARSIAGIPVRVLLNDRNFGLGGSHKVGFDYALRNGFDHVVMLHGDDQGSIRDLVPLIESREHRRWDCLLGARFMPRARLAGYSRFRTFGNHVFNLLFSLVVRHRLHDLGSGLNLYAVRALADRSWARFEDDLTFNYCAILHSASRGWRIRFFPISWREDDQVSNVKLFAQARKVLHLLAAFAHDRDTLTTVDRSRQPDGRYTAEVVFENDAAARRYAPPAHGRAHA